MEKTEQILNLVKTTELNVADIAKEVSLSKEEVIKILIDNEYYRLADNPRAKFFSVKKLHDAAIDYVTNFNGKISINTFIKERGVEAQVFREYIRKWYPENLSIRYNRYNATIFDTIDTEEKAYWLGFIFADGYISDAEHSTSHKYSFELSLASKDEEHLKKFAKFVDYTGTIEHRIIKSCPTGKKSEYGAVRITLNGDHLWNTLNSYGCTPKKSLTLKFPDLSIFSNTSLIRHFIRGYWDGDGTLGIYDNTHYYKNKKHITYHTKPVCGVLGTFEFLTSVCNFLPFTNEIRLHSTEKCPCKAYNVTFACKEAFATCFYLYNNCSIYLDRKYIKFLEICRLYEESYKLLVDKIGEDCDVNPELISSIAKGELIV